jgi:hypothetical protein
VATLIQIENMSEYPAVVAKVLNEGMPRSPRGVETLDLGHTLVSIQDPTKCLAVGVGRGLSTRVAAAEAIQLIGGFHDPKLMLWASPNFAKFMDRDTDPHLNSPWTSAPYFHGAYGRRIGTQMSDVHRKLRADSATRQAVVTLWDPARDCGSDMHDYPCTVGFGFQIVDDKLNMGVVMRSNDVWLGFPYDVFQFTQLQLSLATSLGIPVGIYEHYAWSLHLYADDIAKTEALDLAGTGSFETSAFHRTYQPQGIGRLSAVGDGTFSFAVTRGSAQMLPYMSDLDYDFKLTESEQWYVNQFRSFHRDDKA